MSAGDREQGSSTSRDLPPVLERGPLVVLVVLVFLPPLITANLTALGLETPLLYDAVELPRLVISALGALIAAVLFMLGEARRPRDLRWNWTLVGIEVLALLALVSALFALDPRAAVLGQTGRLEGVVTFVVYAFLVGVTVQVVRGIGDVRVLAGALVVASALAAAYGVVQWAGMDPTTYEIANPGFELERAFATFANPNYFAGFLVLAVPPTAAFASRAKTAGPAFAMWAVTALVLVALLGTFTRGAFIALGVEVLVFGGLLLWKRVQLSTTARWGAGTVSALVVGAAALTIGRRGETDLLERLVGSAGQASIADRLLGWQAAVEAAVARPLLGYGPDSFVAAFRLHRPDAYADVAGLEGTLGNAHSWPLQVAATIGTPAALVVVAAIALGLWAGFRVLRASSPAAPADPVYVGVWIGCIGFSVHMLTNVATPGATTPFWILIAAMSVPAAHTFAGTRFPASFWRFASAATGLLLVLAIVGAGVVLSADASYLRARAVYRNVLTGDAEEAAQRAVALNPLSIRYRRGLAQIIADEYYVALSANDAETRARAFSRSDEHFLLFLERHPEDYAGHAWYSALLAAESRAADSAGVASRATELDRHATQVQALAEGSTEPEDINAALVVPGLP